jgi:integrase
MRKKLTDKGVVALKPRAKRYAYPDPELVGHYVRVTPSGDKSFVAVARDPRARQVWTVIGKADLLTVEEAREQARAIIKRVRAGKPARESPVEPPGSFESIAEQWLKRHVRAKGLRSHGEVERLLKAHVYPCWKGRTLLDIRRSDVTALLDSVEDDHGARQADYVLAIVRGIMNWFAARNDDYQPPIVRGMKRQSAREQARDRVLADDEIRAIWKQAEVAGTFGAFVRVALLTGQRRAAVAGMKWSDIVQGVWKIPQVPREKGNAGDLVLPPATLAIVASQPRQGENPYVFAAGRGDGHIAGFSKLKRTFEAALPRDADVAPWTVHDLRRTFRSLLSRAGVERDIAERCMGHAIPGVEGIYDQYPYTKEKADALARLAALIDVIVRPRDNVLPMAKRRRKRA